MDLIFINQNYLRSPGFYINFAISKKKTKE